MSKYQKSIIYKIYDNTNNDVYYGSTYNLLRIRISKHRSDAKRKCNKASQPIILNDNYDYSMVEKYPCNSKQELHARERYWIENFECINKKIPGRTEKEYKTLYNAKNKEHINEQHAEYYAKNKEEISKKRAIKIVCECGAESSRANMARHLKRPTHAKLMALVCPPCLPSQSP